MKYYYISEKDMPAYNALNLNIKTKELEYCGYVIEDGDMTSEIIAALKAAGIDCPAGHILHNGEWAGEYDCAYAEDDGEYYPLEVLHYCQYDGNYYTEPHVALSRAHYGGGNIVPEDGTVMDENGNIILEDDAATAEDCEGVYHVDDLYEHSDGYYYTYEEEDETGLADYHTRQRPTVRGEKGKTMVGIELELRCADRADLADDLPSGCVGERDGSLDDDEGIEVIIFAVPEAEAYKKIARVCECAVDRNALGHNAGVGYGCHVNLCRCYASELTWGKVQCYLAANIALMEVIAQRPNGSYNSAPPTDGRIKKNLSRKTWLNLDNKRAEFRLFRSNLRPERVRKNVQTCLALVALMQETSVRDCETADLCGFVDKNRKTYPDLYDFLVEKGRITTKKGKGGE